MSLQEIVKKEYVENDHTLCFKTTPLAKIFLLSLATGGIYNIILSLNYWKTLKENFGYKISPFWRGLFEEFTNFRLFPLFAKYFENFNIRIISASLLAGLYFICGFIDWKITFKSTMSDNINWSLELISFILSIINISIFVFIQNKINIINRQYYPDAPKNIWKLSNTIWVIIFLILWALYYLPS